MRLDCFEELAVKAKMWLLLISESLFAKEEVGEKGNESFIKCYLRGEEQDILEGRNQ